MKTRRFGDAICIIRFRNVSFGWFFFSESSESSLCILRAIASESPYHHYNQTRRSDYYEHFRAFLEEPITAQTAMKTLFIPMFYLSGISRDNRQVQVCAIL